MGKQQDFSQKEREELLEILEARFAKHSDRHPGISWADIRERLKERPVKQATLAAMEHTGGEPDVIGQDSKTGEYLFCDCSAESPKGRRSLCYDREALEARKKYKPENSALDLASEMGVELLSEKEYMELQQLGTFDSKTSSWIKTPKAMRELGGALFGDCRYGRVFMYHNGAQSYYSARGFRGKVLV